MPKPKVPGGETNQSRHLRGYVREINRGEEYEPPSNIITAGAAIASKSRPDINYILGGLSDDQYQSKRQ